MKKGMLYIGTSGWHYKHWSTVFYPAGLKAADQLNYFAGTFSSVELNNSFYRLPEVSTFKNWYKQVPENFIFAVKASRFITHLKKLHVDKAIVDEFMERAGHLKEKLGPVLFQLPPKWNINTERFGNFLKLLPRGHRFVFEFRNGSWNDPEIYGLLQQYGFAYCIYELAGYQAPLVVTTDFIYIRLHGPGDKYEGSYTKQSLAAWARRCRSWQEEGKDVYLYFDNDQHGYAALNAYDLLTLLNKPEQD